MGKTEKILIIDDKEFHRRKMSLAVSALNYESDWADGGAEGLLKLKKNNYDLVLLDILMPGMDGFEVMEYMKKDPKMRDIPVIVISALDSEMDSVVKAIEFGAQDFLPKNFDPVLLEARLTSSLERKRNRDRELEQLHQVERLTDAAAILEEQVVDPERLQISDIAQRKDALGQLARVFTGMASQVYEREKRLRQQVRTLRSTGMLLGVGLVAGLTVVLSRVAAEYSDQPFGIALWVNVVCACICIPTAMFRGKIPKFDANLIMVFALWGFLATVVAEVVVLWVAQELPASIIALILVSEGFIVFAFASMIKIEEANLRRLLGFAVGLTGVSLVIFSSHSSGVVSTPWIWALLALLAPLGYALRTLLLTIRLPQNMDMVAATGFSAVSGIILLIPLVIYFDDFFLISFSTDSAGGSSLALAILLFGIVTAVSVTMRVSLIRSAGAVFASQSSFVVTFAGIGWSIILLGESLPAIAWVALLLLVVGLLLVGPKEEAEERDPIAVKPPERAEKPVDLEL
jgi:DNA-binding response OmpR family regulator